MGQVICSHFLYLYKSDMSKLVFYRSLTGHPPPPGFPVLPPLEFDDTMETEVRTPVPENELVEDMDCTMLADLFSEFVSFNRDGPHVGLIAIKLGPIRRVCKNNVIPFIFFVSAS